MELFTSLLLAQGTGSAFTGILPIILMFAIVYFIVLRPMSRQEKDRKKRVETLKKGDQVVIGGGILGRISNLDDPKVAVVEIADKVKIRVMRKDILDAAEAALAAADPPKGKGAADKDKDKDKADAKDKAEPKPESAARP
jgi:preprotein translocase subunit YajC